MITPTEPRPVAPDLVHRCLSCRTEQTPDQARWGHALAGLVFPEWWTWLCVNCDEPWSQLLLVDRVTGEYLVRPSQLPKAD